MSLLRSVIIGLGQKLVVSTSCSTHPDPVPKDPVTKDADIMNIYSSWINYEMTLYMVFGELNKERIIE